MLEKRSLTIERERYYSIVYIYQQRKKEAIKKNKSTITIDKSINSWTNKIQEIDKINNKIISLANMIAIFTGYNIKYSNRRSKSGFHVNMKLAKSLFYKYGIENNIPTIHLREFVGDKNTAIPNTYRKSFNKSFKTNPDNKDFWRRFVAMYEDRFTISNDFIDNRKVK